MTPTYESSSAAKLIVCERTGRWAVALRRELAERGRAGLGDAHAGRLPRRTGREPRLVRRDRAGGERQRAASPVGRQPRQFPAARLAVVADRSQAGYEWLMREAGAVHFLCSPREVAVLARLACRHLAEVPPAQQSLAERIWASLPWA